MVRRFAAPIKKQYPDQRQRGKQREDFCLNFKLEPAEDATQQSQEDDGLAAFAVLPGGRPLSRGISIYIQKWNSPTFRWRTNFGHVTFMPA